MYRYNKKATSLIFGICLMLGIVFFGVFGATFAYFQIENIVEQNYILGKVGAVWCQNGTEINSSSIYINTESSLVRGDDSGVDLSGGMLSIKAQQETEPQYVRVKYIAYVEDVEVQEITNNLVLRVKSGSSFIEMNDTQNVSLWRSGGDGWYYYNSGEPLYNYSSPINVCDNIMLKELDESYLNKELQIKLVFETLQSDNNPVEAIWGTGAKTALGLS